jgi:hypothetical protein
MLDKFINSIKKSPTAESKEDLTLEPESALEKPKSRGGMIIKVLIVLGLGYLLVDMLILNPNGDQVTEVPNVPVKPRKKNNLKKKEEKKEDSKVVKDNENIPPVENVNVLPKNTTDTNAEKIESSNIVKSEMNEKKDDITSEAINSLMPFKEQKTDSQVGQKADVSNDQKINQMIELEDKKDEKLKNNLQDSINVDETYVDPPNYEILGRGLVYNCKGKHWACVDKPAYVACNKNMKFNKANKKSLECVISNVYNSVEDCNIIQKSYISNNQSTDFCSGN